MNNGVSFFKEGIALNGINGADELNRSIVDVRLYQVVKILLVLNYAGYYEVFATSIARCVPLSMCMRP